MGVGIATASGTGLVSCAPLPAWVEPLPLDIANEPDNAAIGAGVHRLVYEVQTDLTQSELAWSLRTVRRVLSREGAEQLAHVLVDFDPSFQRLEVHCVRIRRGAEAIEHGRREDFAVFRRETDIARSMLNGRMTASLLISDLRTDDLVEIALTLYGSNPALGANIRAGPASTLSPPGQRPAIA